MMVAGLAGSRACDGTGAVSDVGPPDGMAGAAGTFVGVEGCRVAGAAPRGRGVAAAAPEAEAGLGRPCGARSAGAATPGTTADEPAGDAGHAAGLAPAAGPLAVDLPAPGRTPACRRPDRSSHRADGTGEPGLGLQADSGRAARPRVPGRGIHGAADPEAASDPARAAAHPLDMAAVPAFAGLDHAGLRLFPRRLRGHFAPRLCVLRDGGRHSSRPCPGRDPAPGRRMDGAAGPEPADGPGGARRPVAG